MQAPLGRVTAQLREERVAAIVKAGFGTVAQSAELAHVVEEALASEALGAVQERLERSFAAN